MYEMLTGVNPFKTGRETTFVDQMNSILSAKIEIPASVGKETADLCRALLEKDVSNLL